MSEDWDEGPEPTRLERANAAAERLLQNEDELSRIKVRLDALNLEIRQDRETLVKIHGEDYADLSLAVSYIAEYWVKHRILWSLVPAGLRRILNSVLATYFQKLDWKKETLRRHRNTI